MGGGGWGVWEGMKEGMAGMANKAYPRAPWVLRQNLAAYTVQLGERGVVRDGVHKQVALHTAAGGASVFERQARGRKGEVRAWGAATNAMRDGHNLDLLQKLRLSTGGTAGGGGGG